MLSLTLFAALFAAVLTPVFAIIDGAAVTGDAYEYTVAIMQPALAGGRGSTPFICNGVLVSEFSVITAAECVQGLQASDVAIRVGFPGSEQNTTVNNIITMGTFNYTTLAGDVAILNLTSAVSNITPANLASASLEGGYPTGSVNLVGWGGTQNVTQSIAPSLQSVTVNVIRPNTCAAALSSCGFKLNRMQRFCTSSTAQGAEGYGDAGGPVVDSAGIVVGLMTGNPACAQPNSLAIQLLLSNSRVHDFIQTNKYGSA